MDDRNTLYGSGVRQDVRRRHPISWSYEGMSRGGGAGIATSTARIRLAAWTAELGDSKKRLLENNARSGTRLGRGTSPRGARRYQQQLLLLLPCRLGNLQGSTLRPIKDFTERLVNQAICCSEKVKVDGSSS